MTENNRPQNAKQMKAKADRRALILHLVLSAGTSGTTMAQISKRTGYSVGSVRDYVHAMRNAGEIECSHPNGGTTTTWGPIGTRAAYVQANAAKMARSQRVTAQRKAAAERRVQNDIESDAFSRDSIVRIVPAHLAEPLRPRGPCSVWGLASC